MALNVERILDDGVNRQESGDITLTGHERLGSYGVGMTLAPVSYNVTVSRLRSSPMQCGCISDFR
jgi:hypothetical protein